MTLWTCTICDHKTESESCPVKCQGCSADDRAIVPEVKQKGYDFFGIPDNLEEVRVRARQKLKGICAVYPACDGDPARICQKEAYGKPIGFGGAGSGSSFAANFSSLASFRLKTRVVGEHFIPNTEAEFLGQKLSMPIIGASTAGLEKYNNSTSEIDFCRAVVRGCNAADTLAFRGDTWFYTEENNPSLDSIEEEKGRGIPIFKPRDQDVLKRLIARAEKAGCPAVGIDLDGCGSTIMARHGQPVFRKSVKNIRELVDFTSLPFITKGIMTPEDAEDCVLAGAKVISISNHGGRVLDATPGVADVLPEISERVGKFVTITADGGVRTGYDVLKMIALGADIVLIGRDVIRASLGGGSVGVRLQMERFKNTLRQAMMMTRCETVKDINFGIFY